MAANAPSMSCPPPIKATSNGAWSGDNPVKFALPLLIIQLVLILAVSRLIHFILKPMRQPRVIAEILGGVILGSSVLGYIPGFSASIFPPSSTTVLTTVANLGLLFFLFTVGLELDLKSLKSTGKEALFIAAAGISLPFVVGVGASYAIRDILGVDSSFGPFLVFMGVAMSITAFPVLARILAERKLLTTDVGQLAMSAAAVNDVMAWILLALAVALSSSGSSPAVVAWILLSGLAFLLVMFLVVRPFMLWISRQVVDNEPLPEWMVATTIVLMLCAGFATDAIGIHEIFGAFVMGLIIPKDGPFAAVIIEKLEDITSIVLLPLYFASSGLNINLASINEGKAWGLVALVIAVACVGKIGGTVAAALLSRISLRKAVVLGVLMNTKGLVELVVLNIGLEKKVINQEIYIIMVVMALVTTFMTTPLVMLLYEPAREKAPYTHRRVEGKGVEELRMLVCVHGMRTIPPMLNLLELARGTRKQPLNATMLHLLELSERSSAIAMVTRVRRNGKPFWSLEAEAEGGDQVVVAFQHCARLSKVKVKAMTAISGFGDMHEDVGSTAADCRANLIVLPYHKYLTADGHVDMGNPGFDTVNQRVKRTAPCSVAILVDRGLGGFQQMSPNAVVNRVGVFFLGGPDDREALSLGRRMAEHPGVSLSVVVFRPASSVAEGTKAAALAMRQASLQREGGGGSLREGEGGGAHLGASWRGLGGAQSFAIPASDVEFEGEARLDEAAVESVRASVEEQAAVGGREEEEAGERGAVSVVSVQVENGIEEALRCAQEEVFDLILVGRGRNPSPLLLFSASHTKPTLFSVREQQLPEAEQVHGLGPIGDALGAKDAGVKASVLVMQQHEQGLVRGSTGRAVRQRPARQDAGGRGGDVGSGADLEAGSGALVGGDKV